MSSSTSEPDGHAAPQLQPGESEDLSRLRHLILGPFQDRLGRLETRIENPKLRATDVSAVLPEAVSLREYRDKRLSSALMGIVEEIVRFSVRKNREILASALSPLISLAVRKSLTEFFQRMLQSLNETLEVTWSWRGLKWRLESLRTGKSFAEIVLLHTLEYRVEQVFLIHADTGLLIDHVIADPAKTKDPDLVSGMLKAIQDFISDSFAGHEEGRLDVIAFGDLSIWLENGPGALLACAIRGNAPLELRDRFRDALERIHREKGSELASFDGDSSPFESTRSHLEACLVLQRKKPQSRVSPSLWVMLGLAGLLVAAGVSVLVRDWFRWRTFLQKLEAEPGIVVLTEDQHLSGYSISGLRDPLAIDPQHLLRESDLDPAEVEARWEPYLALEPALVLARARVLLSPPETVSLRAEGNVLIMEGSAPHQWIRRAGEFARFVPSITEVRTTGLVDVDLQELDRLRKEVSTIVIRFRIGTPELLPGEEALLSRTVEDIRASFERLRDSGLSVRLVVVGHSDPSGQETRNFWLSQARADRVRDVLRQAGLDPGLITSKGTGSSEPVSGVSEGSPERNRSVTFRVVAGNQG